jgi:hypothetical protein
MTDILSRANMIEKAQRWNCRGTARRAAHTVTYPLAPGALCDACQADEAKAQAQRQRAK